MYQEDTDGDDTDNDAASYTYTSQRIVGHYNDQYDKFVPFWMRCKHGPLKIHNHLEDVFQPK